MENIKIDLMGTEFTNAQILLAFATGIGFMGGFPAPPKIFAELSNCEWFKWSMAFILIWQGGGIQNLKLSLITTSVLYIVTKILDRIYSRIKKRNYERRTLSYN